MFIRDFGVHKLQTGSVLSTVKTITFTSSFNERNIEHEYMYYEARFYYSFVRIA